MKSIETKTTEHKIAFQSKADHSQSHHSDPARIRLLQTAKACANTDMLVLLRWPWSWPDDLNICAHLKILKTYLQTKNELSRSRLLKVTAFTYRHADKNTDRCDWTHHHAALAGGENNLWQIALCLNDYFSSDVLVWILQVNDWRQWLLTLANTRLLSVPRTRTTYGDRSFAISGPTTWNSLSVALRSSDAVKETFQRHLIV